MRTTAIEHECAVLPRRTLRRGRGGKGEFQIGKRRVCAHREGLPIVQLNARGAQFVFAIGQPAQDEFPLRIAHGKRRDRIARAHSLDFHSAPRLTVRAGKRAGNPLRVAQREVEFVCSFDKLRFRGSPLKVLQRSLHTIRCRVAREEQEIAAVLARLDRAHRTLALHHAHLRAAHRPARGIRDPA